jgi:hypothetical protein
MYATREHLFLENTGVILEVGSMVTDVLSFDDEKWFDV